MKVRRTGGDHAALRAASPSASPNTGSVGGWAAYAACAWAWAFAAVSAYWALGGTAGVGTVAADVAAVPLADSPAFVWGTAGAKALLGLLALGLARPRGRSHPRRVLLAAAWAVGALLALYGAANLVDHGRMVAGFRDTPAFLGERAARWHLLFWDPVWLLGGVLFLAAAWQARHGAQRP
jgi:hypothetical protein